MFWRKEICEEYISRNRIYIYTYITYTQDSCIYMARFSRMKAKRYNLFNVNTFEN